MEQSEVEDLVRQGQEQLKQMMPRGGPRGAILLAFLLLAGLGAWTAFYTVPSDSVAVVQRFGKYLKEMSRRDCISSCPWVSTWRRTVPVKRQLKQEFGFTTPGAIDPYQWQSSRTTANTKRETEMVTGDLNAALVEWVVQYRISDPCKFLFEVREPRETLRVMFPNPSCAKSSATAPSTRSSPSADRKSKTKR